MTTRAPRVLFVCAGNAGKTGVNTLSAQAVAEVGADISAHTAQAIAEADLVVILGEQAHPDLPQTTAVQRWITDEPCARGIEGTERVRIIRDDITTRVHALREELLDH